MNKLISIRNPVVNALEDMGIDASLEIPVLTRWASEAEKFIGSYYALKKQRKVIEVQNCRAELTCDVAFVQYVLLGDFGCDCDDLFSTCNGTLGAAAANATATGSFAVVDVAGDSEVTWSDTAWEVQDNKIVFQKDLNGKKITIQYLGYEADAEGFLKVGENHVEAITEYIMYKYIIRSRFSPNKLGVFDLRHHESEWHRLCSHARAEDAQLSDTDRDEILAVIHDPLVGYGLGVGMTNNY